jgi:hypothetical protein
MAFLWTRAGKRIDPIPVNIVFALRNRHMLDS